MVKIEYLADNSGASRFGTCAGCSKGSKEDPEMVRVTFWTGRRKTWQGTSFCLCKECQRELYEKIWEVPLAIEGEKADSQSIYLEKMESRLDDSIKDPTKDPEFTKSCLQAYKNIIATGGCNECAIRAMCNKRPDWGKLVRYNCIYFRRDNNV